MGKLKREFFSQKPEIVARGLLGKLLVRKARGTYLVGKIVETEAYLGEGDKASHSHRGETKRNAPMFGEPGHSYIYFTYGLHWLLNVVTEEKGKPSGVLIRAVEPILFDKEETDLKRLGSGPARLTKWLKINGELNSMDLTKSDTLYISEELELKGKKVKAAEELSKESIVTTTRVGVDYAGEHKDLPLRFYIKGNKYISSSL